MIKSIFTSLFAVTLFAGGAVGAWYIMKLDQETTANSEADLPGATAPALAPVSSTTSEEESDTAPLSDFTSPVLGKALSGEDIFRFTAMNKKNLELMKERREALRQEEMRLKLVEKDLEIRKQEIEGVLQQSRDTVAAAEDLISKLQAQVNALNEEKAAIQENQDETATDDASDDEIQANIKVSAGWLATMPPEQAASAVKSLANEGKKDFVLQLLSYIEDRNVAKILHGLNDPALVAELTESFRTAKRPQKKKRR